VSRRLASILILAALCASAAIAPARATAAESGGSEVATWIDLTLAEIPSHRLNPPRASRVLAHVSVAMHDAAFATAPEEDSGVAGAASTVLAHFFPDRADYFEALAKDAADDKKALKVGRQIGEGIVVRAQSDGADAQWAGEAPTGQCVWVPTPPGFVYPPLEPLGGTWRTWNLASGSQFRPAPPPGCDSKDYRAAAREVYKISRHLTAEQKRIAEYWADGPGSVTPPGHWNLIALELVERDLLSTLASARVFAAMNTAQGDAFIACWDSKYTYWLERPATVIRREIDPDWLPYIPTPPFPGYTSGHASTSGAASEVLAHFFPLDAVQLRADAEEAAVSRLYGGIHFRFDNDEGLALGRKIAVVALASRFVSP
jgi:hypothetical protein